MGKVDKLMKDSFEYGFFASQRGVSFYDAEKRFEEIMNDTQDKS